MTTTQIAWAVAAVLLMAAEMAAPGAFMLWLGFAAAGVFVLVWCVPTLAAIWQALAFAGFSVITVSVYWKAFRKTQVASDRPLLNRRGMQHIGQHYELTSAIVNGRGKARVGDTQWLVEGPDLPVGAMVEVIGVDGSALKVKAVG